jgi:hypothetical protein
MNSIRLVTRADDAGLNRITNRAIRSAVSEGIVRNVSLMAPAPAIEDAAENLGSLAGTVDFGLHVVLTSEWDPVRWGPVSSLPEGSSLLRRDGTFHLLAAEVEQADVPLDEIMAEVQAQHDRLVELGFRLSYLDEHMLVGDISTPPGLVEALNEFAHANGLVSDRELRASGKLHDLPGWQGPGEHPGTELADHLSGTADGTYLLAGHPGTKDEEMQILRVPGGRPGDVALKRNRERRMFMDMEIVDYCENVGISLARYSEVGLE